MTEYKKLTKIEISNLQPGIKVNFGNGNICEIIKFYDGQKYKAYKNDELIDCVEKKVDLKYVDGNVVNAYTMNLLSATIETLDSTIEECAYCHSLRPANEMKSQKIWVNFGTQINRYCADKACGSYDQMAAEG